MALPLAMSSLRSELRVEDGPNGVSRRAVFIRLSWRSSRSQQRDLRYGAPAQSLGFRKLNLQASNTLLVPRIAQNH